jgi:CBS domain containing-hemolysin-like protein
MDLIPITFLVVAVLTLLSAILAASETAYVTLPRESLESLIESRRRGASAVKALMAEPRRLIVSIRVGVLFLRLAVASLAGFAAYAMADANSIPPLRLVLIEIFVVGAILLIFGEMLPRTLVLQRREAWVAATAPLLRVYCILMSPLAMPLIRFLHGIARLFGREERIPYLTAEQLIAVVEGGEEEGAELEEGEREMIHSIFEFGDTAVREVMVPRIDMVAAPASLGLDEALALATERGKSRIPVYDGTVDQIIGILYVKDLLRHVPRPDRNGIDLRTLVRKPYYVPETKKIDELLREFQREKIHMAIVVDEYGGTAGIVTLEDVLEEIVGEIHDEHDREERLFVPLGQGGARADAKISIYDLNERIDANLPEEDYDTLAGYIFHLIGSVPKGGEVVEDGKFRYTVEKVVGQRIRTVRIERMTPVEDEESAAPAREEEV